MTFGGALGPSRERQHGVVARWQLVDVRDDERGRSTGWCARGEAAPLPPRRLSRSGPLALDARKRDGGGPCLRPERRGSVTTRRRPLRTPPLPSPTRPGRCHDHGAAPRGRHPGIRRAPHQLPSAARASRASTASRSPSPQRTLIDLAVQPTRRQLESAVAEAFALRPHQPSQLLRALDATAGPARRRRLRVLLDGERGPARTRSGPSVGCSRLDPPTPACPEPEVNARIGRWEVDLLWRDQGARGRGRRLRDAFLAAGVRARPAKERRARGPRPRGSPHHAATANPELAVARVRRTLATPSPNDISSASQWL